MRRERVKFGLNDYELIRTICHTVCETPVNDSSNYSNQFSRCWWKLVYGRCLSALLPFQGLIEVVLHFREHHIEGVKRYVTLFDISNVIWDEGKRFLNAFIQLSCHLCFSVYGLSFNRTIENEISSYKLKERINFSWFIFS